MSIRNADMRTKPVLVHYLKMEQCPEWAALDEPAIVFKQLVKPIQPEQYLYYYKSVGFEFNWLDRFVMPTDELIDSINSPNVRIFIMTIHGKEAGFLELVVETEYVEILYFGLFPTFVGKGFGKFFLNWSIQKAWSYQPKWIQLNTCELDHNNALPTYLKLGFIEYKTTVEDRRILR